MSIGGLTSSRHQENSCEVHRKGDSHRTIVYGLTREEVIVVFDRACPTDAWQEDFVVTPTRRLAMGFSPARTQVTRGSREYD